MSIESKSVDSIDVKQNAKDSKDFIESKVTQSTKPICFKPLDYSINTCMIFTHSPTPPCDIDYVHFVDSDDMLSIDCIEQCIESIGDNDIVWHDVEYLYEEGIEIQSYPSLLQSLSITQEEANAKSFTPLELWKNMDSFSFVHQGLFAFSLTENLRFSTPLMNEDALFGMILFAHAKAIKVASFYGLIYRHHTNSVSTHGEAQNLYRKSYPSFMLPMIVAFNNDGYSIKHYYFGYSCTFVCLGLLRYIQSPHFAHNNNAALRKKLIAFMKVRAIYAFNTMIFDKDPMHTRELLKPLEPYMQKVSLPTKLAYFTPRFYKLMRTLKRTLKAITS